MSVNLTLSVECSALRALVRMRDEEIEELKKQLAARDAEIERLREGGDHA